MFWIGFLVGILVIPALAFLTLAVFFCIDAIPYVIKVIKKFFAERKVKKGIDVVNGKKNDTTSKVE
jgi:hypothetical protein